MRVTILIFSFIVFTELCCAQEGSFHIKAGYNISSISNNSINFQNGSGYQIGLTRIFSVSEKFSFESGLMFIKRGVSAPEELIYLGDSYGLFEDPSGSAYVQNKINLNSLQIPISVNFNLTQSLSISFGGNLDYIFNSDAQYFTGGFVQPFDWDKQLAVEDMIYGPSLGLEYNFRKLLVELNYTYYVNNLSPELERDYGQNKISSFSINLGYMF